MPLTFQLRGERGKPSPSSPVKALPRGCLPCEGAMRGFRMKLVCSLLDPSTLNFPFLSESPSMGLTFLSGRGTAHLPNHKPPMKQHLSETASFPLLLRTALVQKLRRTNDPWLENCLLQLQLIRGFAGRLHSGLAAARAGSIMPCSLSYIMSITSVTFRK